MAIRFTADGFSTPLVKRDRDGWFGFVEPALLGRDEGPLWSILRNNLITALPMFFVDVCVHWWRVAPWAPWSLRLSRGELSLRMHGRRRVQPLARLQDVEVDDYGLQLRFDDHTRWSIPPQPAATVNLFELAGQLQRASESARAAAPEEARATRRAQQALAEVREAPPRR